MADKVKRTQGESLVAAAKRAPNQLPEAPEPYERVHWLVCTNCYRAPGSTQPMRPAGGADPESYSRATVTNEAGVLYIALHTPDCYRPDWAKGGAK